MMMTKIVGTATAVLCFGLFALPSGAAGPDCDAATRELSQAQAALSRATRNADTSADALGQCMAKGGNCDARKAAYDTALAAKKRALAAMTAATSRVKNACR